MYRTFNINAHARSTLQNLNRLCGTCKINPINIAWEFKKKIDTMFKDAFDSLCFYSDLTKTTKLVNFLYSKEEDNDPGSLFRYVSQTEENIYVLFFSFPILIKSLTVCVHRCFGM